MGVLKKLSIFTASWTAIGGGVFYYWLSDPTNYYQNKQKCVDFYYQYIKKGGPSTGI